MSSRINSFPGADNDSRHKPEVQAMTLSLPVFRGLRGYRASWLPADISAGLAVAAVGLPSAIAYPAIVGLPLETGLYASIAAPIAYAVFGASRILIVGPDAATMTVLAVAVASIIPSLPGDALVDRATIASLIALVVGGDMPGSPSVAARCCGDVPFTAHSCRVLRRGFRVDHRWTDWPPDGSDHRFQDELKCTGCSQDTSLGTPAPYDLQFNRASIRGESARNT